MSGDGTPPYGEVGSSERFVGLFLRGAMDEWLGPAGPIADAPDRFSLVFEVPDVDRTLDRLEKAEVAIEIGATDRPLWGLRTVHRRDPDGNLVELYTRLRPVPRRPARKRATGGGTSGRGSARIGHGTPPPGPLPRARPVAERQKG